MQSTKNATKKTASSPKCKKPHATSQQKKQALSPRSKAPELNRTTFKTSREMDFFSEKELVTHTGHSVDEWLLVILKELIDNALDACEEGVIAPAIEVSADATGVTILDNGPGLPEDTLQGALDFTVRTSNREAYVGPCRGAQGNALKTILSMARVVDPEHGQLIIETLGKRHTIRCGCDPISQRAVVHHDIVELPKCKNRESRNGTINQALSFGTSIRIEWGARPNSEWPFGDHYPHDDDFARQFRELFQGFAVFNPHLSLTLNWLNERTTWEATDPSWNKWKPNKPTSATARKIEYSATNRSWSSKPWRPTWLLDTPGTHMSTALTTLPNDIDREHGRATKAARTALELARRMTCDNEKREASI